MNLKHALTSNETVLDDRRRKGMKEWFDRQGVPTYCGDYSARMRETDILLLLSLILAFQIGAAPLLPLESFQMLLVPPVMVAVVLLFQLPFARLLRSPWTSRRSYYVLPLAVVLSLALLYSLRRGPESWLNANPWAEFFVVACAALVCILLLPEHVWQNDKKPSRSRRFLKYSIVGAFVVFTLEGAAFPSLTSEMNGALARLNPSLPPLPDATFALLFVDIVLAVALRLNYSPAGDDRILGPVQRNTYVPLVPILVLVIGLDALIGDLFRSLSRVGVSLALAFTLILIASLVIRTRPYEPVISGVVGLRGRVTKLASGPGVKFLLLFYLIGYPLWYAAFDQASLYNVLSIFVSNVAYVCLAVLVVAVGIDRVTIWAIRATRDNLVGMIRGLTRGLPLLLVFAVFFGLTAEVWEVAAEIDTRSYVLLLLIVLIVTLVVLSATLIEQIGTANREFENWDEFNASVDSVLGRSARTESLSWTLDEAKRLSTNLDPPKLGKRERMNSFAIMVVYASSAYIPIAVGSFVLFYVIGRLSVSEHIAAEWVYGDRAGMRFVDELAQRGVLEAPWTRVAALLALISILYRTVTLASDRNQRQEFFRGATDALRGRFAARLAYYGVFRSK